MALALESDHRTVIGEVVRKHGLLYERLKEEQLFTIVPGHRVSLYTGPLSIPFSYATLACRMRYAAITHN